MRLRLSSLTVLAAACLFPVGAHAQLYLDSGHVDLNIGFSAPTSEFGLYAHHTPPEANAPRDEPVDNAAFFVSDIGGKIPSAGGLLPFLGQPGQPVWLIPQNSPPPNVPWVGFGGYGVDGAEGEPAEDLSVFDPLPTLTGHPTTPAVRIRFLRATVPAGADFAVWQTGATGTPTLFFSNRPDTIAPQVFGLRRGQHAHFNWGFSQPGHYRIHLRLEGSIGGVAVPARDFAVDFAVSVLPLYEQWRRASARFSATERAARAIGGPAADPDGDGLPNLLEYALGREPRLADASAGAPVLRLDASTPRLTFTRVADPLLIYAVEGSTDLATWTELWRGTGTDNTAGSVEVVAPAPLSPGDPRSFLRLRVNHVE
ncbi:MAG: choice-of-anchor M domain-containing protein [Opitutaceae bacterium]|jgi:surface-anchored protein|nr:choice-of-anchor M domain-containing protein [Opitutaceae bacterium]